MQGIKWVGCIQQYAMSQTADSATEPEPTTDAVIQVSVDDIADAMERNENNAEYGPHGSKSRVFRVPRDVTDSTGTYEAELYTEESGNRYPDPASAPFHIRPERFVGGDTPYNDAGFEALNHSRAREMARDKQDQYSSLDEAYSEYLETGRMILRDSIRRNLRDVITVSAPTVPEDTTPHVVAEVEVIDDA